MTRKKSTRSSGQTGASSAPSKTSRSRRTGDADRRPAGQGRAGRSDRSNDKIAPTKLRIIGGDMRNRPVHYHGDRITRPMRDSVRENLFNILGRACRGAVAFDLFGGTGVLAFEAISRGARRAVVVEPVRHAITEMKKTIARLDLDDRVTLITGDAFRLYDQILRSSSDGDDTAWIIFMSPPYAMWTDTESFPRLTGIIKHVRQYAPPGSVLIVETDDQFDCDALPTGDWDIRRYGITQLAFLEPANVCGMKSWQLPEAP
ncbi:MAG: RsmD family RNA methyltransferase [Planctomycetota bacterium]